MPHRIISDVYLLKKTWSVFGKREIIANAVKNMSLCRLPARGLHKQFILFSCYCLLVVSCIVLIQYLLRLQRYCFFGICANKRSFG